MTVQLGGWDTHQDNFTKLKDNNLPKLDEGLSGLLTGLEERGLLDIDCRLCDRRVRPHAKNQ